MAWGSALWRRVKVFRLAFQVYLDYRAGRRKSAGLPKDEQALVWNRIHKRNAERILAAITELEGLWVKFGQYLSTRADVLPEVYISMFRQLQDSLPPRPTAEVQATVEQQFGKPLDELFLEFDRKPLATASIAQVHRARTTDGRDVVVKVQHQGIKECILQDLYNARVIVEWVAWAEPEYDFGPVLDEWCREVPKELNFNIEAENTTKVARNLSSWVKDDSTGIAPVDVMLPEVIQSSEKVLILTYMDGVRVNDIAALDRLAVDKQATVETITRAYAHQIYIDGFFNADPHPGNFLISTQPPHRPILLDFGLTKSISLPFRQSLAKMLLAAAEGDYSALLSAFSEMGLVLRLDMPEEAMEITNFFFRRSLPAEESVAEMKDLLKENDKRVQRLKSKIDTNETLRTPVAAFPTDAVFFTRVLGLLRGLSSVLGARVVYLEIMKPYAEAVLYSGSRGIEFPIFDSPLHSQAEVKLQKLLREMHDQRRILGIQVCAYKDGKVIIDTAAGYLGKYDPRPVRPDSLFPVFSATKGITAALLHWLADHGKLSLKEKISNIWPEFAENQKESITVGHALNHTSGLQNALYDVLKEKPLTMCDWNEMLKLIAAAKPESPPGEDQKYHALSFGWICGGIAEKASGKNFQDLLEEAFVTPLNISGEFYVGIPAGVEERLASLTLDPDELKNLPAESAVRTHLPALDIAATSDAVGPASLGDFLTNGSPLSLSSMPSLFNMLFIRRSIIPAANGHVSARALARFYAMLASGGRIPGGGSSSKPPLGSHSHRPKLGSGAGTGKKKGSATKRKLAGNNCCKTRSLSSDWSGGSILFQEQDDASRVYSSSDIHDAFVGAGKYSDLVFDEGGKFGLGFWKLKTDESSGKLAFGHSGIGGSFGYCDPENDFAMAITVNKMSLGQVTGEILRLVCSEIGIPCPVPKQ